MSTVRFLSWSQPTSNVTSVTGGLQLARTRAFLVVGLLAVGACGSGSGSPTDGSGADGSGGSTCVAQAATSGSHTCIRRADGALWCWGENDHGQVGNGTVSSVSPIVAVSG